MIPRILFIIFVICTTLSNAQSIKLMTFNIRYDNPNDGENNWKFRKHQVAAEIKFYEPDIIGIQEGLVHQLAFLDSALTNYAYIGVGRDDGIKKGEFCAVFYNINKIKPVKDETFWLSETPDKVSVGWDAAMERICTSVLFEHVNSGKKLWIFNTHFDHIGEKARINSAKLIVSRIKALKDVPVVVMGDINATPESKVISIFTAALNDSKTFAKNRFGPDGTFNNFDYSQIAIKRIDYIFTDKKITLINKYGVLNNSYACKHISDHFAVFTEFDLPF